MIAKNSTAKIQVPTADVNLRFPSAFPLRSGATDPGLWHASEPSQVLPPVRINPSPVGPEIFRGQVSVFFQRSRAQGAGNGMLLSEPFSQVHEPAARRTKGAKRSRKPVARLLTSWALNDHRIAHCLEAAAKIKAMNEQLFTGLTQLTPHFQTHGFEIARNTHRRRPFDAADLQDRLYVRDNRVKLGDRKRFAVEHRI